jgi:hypothetical protein
MIKQLTIALALLLAACGSADVAAGPAADVVVLEVDSTGGCAQMGPNCTRLVVFGDGTVEAYRFLGQDAELIDTASIDPGLVDSVDEIARTTDFGALRDRLPAGECRGCYDGIDTTMTFHVEGLVEAFSSVDVGLDPAEPLFAAAWATADAASGSIEVPLLTR